MSSGTRTGVRAFGLAAVLVIGVMAALAVAGDTWNLRMTPDGTAVVALVGLFVTWAGASLVLGGRGPRT